MSERLVGREWQCSAELALARAVVMLGAYRAETGRPADSLDAVAGRFGWEAPSVPLSDQKIAYARFPPGTLGGSPAEAYLLACPGDGRAVPKESGRALLVVRNPAFGALPFRQYHWTKLKEKEARGGNVSTSGVWVDESADRAGVGAAADGFRLPLGLLSPKPEAWNRAEFFLENQGWEIGG